MATASVVLQLNDFFALEKTFQSRDAVGLVIIVKYCIIIHCMYLRCMEAVRDCTLAA